ncbi:cofactor assembly of complex C subunit B [Prochlorococcus sp. MIT 1341]|uniref:cofactor assembly of complex C subunit B n=1 Tax=Prochlorococcus sp. MIT 1341 TaxID=3096221 RepID=UPI002A74F2BE|nr:cofactor assembly of complex C subunit B [Prochlorococcus sp. MIT 1341]
MANSAKYILGFGILFLSLTVLNGALQGQVDPGFLRAEVLAGLSSVCLMLISYLSTEYSPIKAEKKQLKGKQGIQISDQLTKTIREEIAWGSKLILTSTPASSLLIYWNDNVLLRRGIIGNLSFTPGEICKRSLSTGKTISLVKTSLYPGRKELYTFVEDIPSVIILPLESKGLLLVGGWSERCFSISDEKLIECWKEKLINILCKEMS